LPGETMSEKLDSLGKLMELVRSVDLEIA